MPRRRRKAWTALTLTYRRRLERAGITEAQHRAGASLAKARGHKSEAAERHRSAAIRALDRYLQRYGALLTSQGGHDLTEIRRELLKLPATELLLFFQAQMDAEEAWNLGQIEESSEIYNRWQEAIPDDSVTRNVFYYHYWWA